MAIVTETFDRDAEEHPRGVKYMRSFNVLLETGDVEGDEQAPDIARRAPGVPEKFDLYPGLPPTEQVARVVRVLTRSDPGNASLFYITVLYEVAAWGIWEEHPLDRVPDINWTGEPQPPKIADLAWEAPGGGGDKTKTKRVITSAGQLFSQFLNSDQLQVLESWSALAYTRNLAKDDYDPSHPTVPWFDQPEAAEYINTINSDVFLRWAAFRVLCRNITAVYQREIVNHLLVEYYRVTYSFLFNPGPTGWFWFIQDEGNEAMFPEGPPPGAPLRRAKITDINGNQIVKLLAADGQPLALGEDIRFLPFQPYNDKVFGGLPII